jgi:Protein of unknown function (DUF1153)
MRLSQSASGQQAAKCGGGRAGSKEDTVDNRVAHTPPTRPARWMPQTKAKVLDALFGGFISLEAACERYGLSIEECLTWQRAMKRFGVAGLQITKTQKYSRRLSAHHSDS